MKKYVLPALIWLVFETVAISLTIAKQNTFFLFNFTYIGTAITAGMILFIKKWRNARRLVQFLVGTYMLVFLGLFNRENMQIEGFWYYLFSGVFEAATIHYAVAKLFGCLIFGRGWCGYCCWTAMVLDLLPFKIPDRNQSPQRQKFRFVRYVTFAVSLVFVGALFLFGVGDEQKEQIMFVAFLVGNALYYAVGIILAYALKDNRAFCKYVCPVTVFLKPMSYFSRMRVVCDESKCIHCNQCRKVCPMEVDMLDPSRKRLNGTECILCGECEKVCPKNALH